MEPLNMYPNSPRFDTTNKRATSLPPPVSRDAKIYRLEKWDRSYDDSNDDENSSSDESLTWSSGNGSPVIGTGKESPTASRYNNIKPTISGNISGNRRSYRMFQFKLMIVFTAVLIALSRRNELATINFTPDRTTVFSRLKQIYDLGSDVVSNSGSVVVSDVGSDVVSDSYLDSVPVDWWYEYNNNCCLVSNVSGIYGRTEADCKADGPCHTYLESWLTDYNQTFYNSSWSSKCCYEFRPVSSKNYSTFCSYTCLNTEKSK